MPKPKHQVNTQTVEKIARLAHLHIDPTDSAPLTKDLNKILNWITKLEEVDIEGVMPMSSTVDMPLPMRQDTVTESDKRTQILANAPKQDEGFYVVPRSVD